MQITQGGRSVWLSPWRLRRTLRQLGQARSLAGFGPGLPSERLRELKAAIARARRCERGLVAPAYGGVLALRLRPGADADELQSLDFALGGEVLSEETWRAPVESRGEWSPWYNVCRRVHPAAPIPALPGAYVLTPTATSPLRYIGYTSSLRIRIAQHSALAHRYGVDCLRVQFVALPGASEAQLRSVEHTMVRAYLRASGFEVTTQTPRAQFRAKDKITVRLPQELHRRIPDVTDHIEVLKGARSLELATP